MIGQAARETLRRLRSHRDSVLQIAVRSGASNVRVLGSVLHGTDTEDSDVDLLVDVPRGATLLDMVAVRCAPTTIRVLEGHGVALRAQLGVGLHWRRPPPRQQGGIGDRPGWNAKFPRQRDRTWQRQ
jgi:Predicted nucleotidyltransferases